MNWEIAGTGLSAIVIILQAVSLYTQSQIKVWSLQTFISKKDFLDTLALWGDTRPRHPHG